MCVRCVKNNSPGCIFDFIKPRHKAPEEAVRAIDRYSTSTSNTNVPVDRNLATNQLKSAGQSDTWSNNQVVNPMMGANIHERTARSDQARRLWQQADQYQPLQDQPLQVFPHWSTSAMMVTPPYAAQAPHIEGNLWPSLDNQDTPFHSSYQWELPEVDPLTNQAMPPNRGLRQDQAAVQHTDMSARESTDELPDLAATRPRRSRKVKDKDSRTQHRHERS